MSEAENNNESEKKWNQWEKYTLTQHGYDLERTMSNSELEKARLFLKEAFTKETLELVAKSTKPVERNKRAEKDQFGNCQYEFL